MSISTALVFNNFFMTFKPLIVFGNFNTLNVAGDISIRSVFIPVKIPIEDNGIDEIISITNHPVN